MIVIDIPEVMLVYELVTHVASYIGYLLQVKVTYLEKNIFVFP